MSLGFLPNLEAYQQRMGWKVPWVSSAGIGFTSDFGPSTDDGETFGLSASCATAARFITPTLLDWTPLGRKTPRPAGRNRSPTPGGAATTSIEAMAPAS